MRRGNNSAKAKDRYSRTGCAVLVAASLLMTAAPLARAGTVDGAGNTQTVGSNDPIEDWVVQNGGSLIVNGGAVISATIHEGSSIEMIDATANATTATNGVSLNSVVDTLEGATAIIDNSSLTGKSGLFLGELARATISNSTLTGKGWAGLLMVEPSNATVTNSTITSMEDFAIQIMGSVANLGDTYLVLDNSRLISPNATAIDVNGLYKTLNAHVTIANGTTLSGINNQLVAAYWDAYLDLVVDNSQLTGMIAADDTATINITLQNNASLTGDLTNVNRLTANSGGSWNLVGDDSLNQIVMNGGTVNISDGSGTAFHKLTVTTLSGNGTFGIGTNLAALTSDMLVVTGADGASGNHVLRIRNSGADPSEEDSLTLVTTNGGDAQFSLTNGVVDIGVFEYQLEKQGNDWVLVSVLPDEIIPGEPEIPTPPIEPDEDIADSLTPSARTVIALHAAAANVADAETAILRQRRGDVRLGQGDSGIWGRTFGRDGNGTAAGGVHYDQTLWGMQAGAEHELTLGGVPVIVGVFGGYTTSDIKLSGRSKGEIGSGYGGLSATWLGQNGFYVDSMVKFNRFSNRARALMSDGTAANGDYDTSGISGQIELGKHINLTNGWYAEPFIQLSALHIGSFDYQLDNGMQVKSDAYASVQGRLGAAIGYNHTLANGATLQPYVRAAIAREFIDRNEFAINSIAFNDEFKGWRGEVATGFAYQFNDRVQIHADIDYAHARFSNKSWGGNLGLTVKF